MKKSYFSEKRIVFEGPGPGGSPMETETQPATPVATATAQPTIAPAPTAAPVTTTEALKPPQAAEALPPAPEAAPQQIEQVTTAKVTDAGKAAADKAGRLYTAADGNLAKLGAITTPEITIPA